MTIVPVYKQASRLLLASRRSCTRVNFVWNLTHVSFWLCGSWISKSGKFLLKLRTNHSGNFAPREINALYDISLQVEHTTHKYLVITSLHTYTGAFILSVMTSDYFNITTENSTNQMSVILKIIVTSQRPFSDPLSVYYWTQYNLVGQIYCTFSMRESIDNL